MSDPAPRVGIIGAGPCGLICGHQLAGSGLDVVVLEKSRGIGGRMATRRRDGLQFDHGAPLASLTSAPSLDVAEMSRAAGHAEEAPPGMYEQEGRAFFGLPGMSDFCRPLSGALDIRFGEEVTTLKRQNGGWEIASASGLYKVDQVVITIPAPQVSRLRGDLDQAMFAALEPVLFAPCYALMIAFVTRPDWPPFQRAPGGPFSGVFRDSAKPGRPADTECWVAHADAAWSRAHLEMERPEAAAALMVELGKVVGPLPQVHMALGHRWRFSQAERVLGRDYLANSDSSVLIGGDWTRGRNVGDAMRSGAAMAAKVLQRLAS